MTAIITSQFRLDMANKLISDVSSTTSNYYMYVGRCEPWAAGDTSPDTPYDNQFSTLFESTQHMQGMKKIDAADVSWCTPRYQWTSGTAYAEYDDRDGNLEGKKYFVITDNLHVYICLRADGNSTKNPDDSGVQTTGIIDHAASDGYIWKYMYTLSTNAANKFLTSAFIPTTFLSSNPGASSDIALQNQFNVQGNAKDGAVYNIKVTAGGSGYTSTPTVAFTGNGDGNLEADVVVTNGVVTAVKVKTGKAGLNYTEVAAIISGGGGAGATCRAVIGPIGGFGADPRNDLRAHYVAINSQLVYDQNGDFVVDNDFRQIGIVRNPTNYNTTTIATADTLNAQRILTIATGDSFAVDTEFEGTVTGAHGIVNHYDSSTGKLRYHQTEATGFKTFTTADKIRVAGGSNTGKDVNTITNPEVERYSGDHIFLENRSPVSRSASQIETIKIVIEL
jgi:hypothetical protein